MNSSNAEPGSTCQILEKLGAVSLRQIPFSRVWVQGVLASESIEKS